MRGVKLILPALALALGAAGCSDDGDVSGVGTTASVRFVNAVADAPGNLILTADGGIVGSLGFASQASTCTTIESGTTVLSLSTATTGGNSAAGSVLTEQSAQLAPGGDYTIIATGNAADPQFLVLSNNSFDGNLNSAQTAVRFANLMTSGQSTFNVFTGSNMFGEPTYMDLKFGAWTAYTKMAAGAQTYIFTDPDAEEIFRSQGLNLEGGKTYTIAVMPTASGGFQLLAITGC
jgi:hypothetical protein